MEANTNLGSLAGSFTNLSAAEAKEYIHALITTIKLTEKEICSLLEEEAKWKNRMELARSKGADDLLAEAEKEAGKINAKLAALRGEAQSHRDSVESLRRQLPGLAARERSIDADLLEQELLMALGQTEEEAGTDRAFRKLEKESSADEALAALKSKMNAEPSPSNRDGDKGD